MIADLRSFVVTGQEPPKTCLGAEAARAEATRRVREGKVGVRIVNAGGDVFRWWPELCSERACYSPAEEESRCALHALGERPRRRRAPVEALELDRAARALVKACQGAEAAGAPEHRGGGAVKPPRGPRRILAFEVVAPGLDPYEIQAAVPGGARRARSDPEHVVLRGRAQALATRDALLRDHPGAAVEVLELRPETEGRP